MAPQPPSSTCLTTRRARCTGVPRIAVGSQGTPTLRTVGVGMVCEGFSEVCEGLAFQRTAAARLTVVYSFPTCPLPCKLQALCSVAPHTSQLLPSHVPIPLRVMRTPSALWHHPCRNCCLHMFPFPCVQCAGPLFCGATQVLFDGVPTYPDAGRCWEIVDKLKVWLRHRQHMQHVHI